MCLGSKPIGVSEVQKKAPSAEFPADYSQNGEGRKDFIWSPDAEPHIGRRKEILKAHPEIKQLYGPDPWILPQIVMVVSFQTVVAYLVATYDLSWWKLTALAYCVGGFANHNLFLAVHECAHNLAFKGDIPNKLTAFIANFPTLLPFAISFQKYHKDHHTSQGDHHKDVDIPTYAEGRLVTNTVCKAIWVFLQLLAYSLRPLVVDPRPAGKWEFLNLLSCLAYDYFVFTFCGGGKAIAYLGFSSLLGGGMHPIAGHFISEHYAFEQDQETYSYYGPLNFIVYNCGYHNEHHDFTRIPGSRLSQVRKLAPEFYDNLYFHTSWTGVIWRYVTDPSVGPFNRVKRTDKSN